VSGGFISLEGIDGCGKSTQARILYERLITRGVSVVLTREPGGTPVGQALRQLCLEGTDPLVWEAEMLLMAADRAQHVAQLIKPALAQGHFVVCDRYVDSSIAYQGYGAIKSIEAVRAVNTIATRGLVPDLTLFLDVNPDARYERPGKADRIEERGPAYYERVYQGFRQIAQDNPRVVPIQVQQLNPEKVASLIWEVCTARFPDLR
jgi:dTMP kinase